MALSCRVCGGPELAARLHRAEVPILFCGRCGTACWLPEAGFRAASLYDARYFEGGDRAAGYDDYAALEPALRETFARRVRALGAPRAGARLLDLGPAFGYALDAALAQGWRAFGLEISPAAAARAAAGGRAVALGDAQRIPFADASFDALTLWDVLEHLPDPHAAMAEIARCLRPGGLLALSTGDVQSFVARVSGARWHLYTLPEHLFFYSREGLRRLCAAHGLCVRSLRAEGARYPLGYLVERLRKSLLGRAASGAARWPGAALVVPVNLFDVVTLHAVREGGRS